MPTERLPQDTFGRRSIRILGALLVLGPCPCGAGPLSWQTVPKGINNLGQVVGFSSDIAGSHAFVESGGAYSYIDLPGSNFTIAYGINDSRQILLFDNQHGATFLDSAGQLTEILAPGIYSTGGLGLNNNGQIVGAVGYSGFLYSGGTFTTISVPGAFSTIANAINDQGVIVGSYYSSTQQEHGFLYANGVFTTIDVPGAGGTQLVGINDVGQIIGNTVGGPYYGFVFSGGQFTPILPPGFTEDAVAGINNTGQIVGSTGNNSGFLFSNGSFETINAPATAFTPEPATFYTAITGLWLTFVRLGRIKRTQ